MPFIQQNLHCVYYTNCVLGYQSALLPDITIYVTENCSYYLYLVTPITAVIVYSAYRLKQ